MNDPSSEIANIVLCISSNNALITVAESELHAAGYAVYKINSFNPRPEGEWTANKSAEGQSRFKPGYPLFDRITSLRPAVMIVDLGIESGWRDWLALMKSDPATRRIPVVCLQQNNSQGEITDAYRYGAELALSRLEFVADIPGWINSLASKSDPQVIQRSCAEPASLKAIEGIHLFNSGNYFEAHEWLEEAWNEDPSPGGNVYRALLQISVFYYHITRQNFNGALKIFLRARQWIDPLPDECKGINIGKLRAEANEAYQLMLKLGKSNIEDFDGSLFNPIDIVLSDKREPMDNSPNMEED